MNRREVELRTIARPEEEVMGDDDVERAEIRRVLHEELDRIPSAYRAAIVTCYLEGLTHEEAANRLGVPVGTVPQPLVTRAGAAARIGWLVADWRPESYSLPSVDHPGRCRRV